MKLSTGKVAFPIEFDNGDKEVIYFNPNDPNLAIRLKNFQKKFEERTKDFADIKLTENGEPESVEAIDQFEKMQNVLYEELDYAFGGEISEKVFKYCSPLAIVNGEYFIILFINAITPEIEKEIKKGNEKAYARMEKHIKKYKK